LASDQPSYDRQTASLWGGVLRQGGTGQQDDKTSKYLDYNFASYAHSFHDVPPFRLDFCSPLASLREIVGSEANYLNASSVTRRCKTHTLELAGRSSCKPLSGIGLFRSGGMLARSENELRYQSIPFKLAVSLMDLAKRKVVVLGELDTVPF
jgi:hypothetical protein